MKISKRQFKKDILEAVNKVAVKHNVQINLKKIDQADDHFESVMTINPEQQSTSTRTHEGPTRREQVAKLIKKGTTSPKEIAEKLGTHPSYVSRLIKEVTTQAGKLKKEVDMQLA